MEIFKCYFITRCALLLAVCLVSVLNMNQTPMSKASEIQRSNYASRMYLKDKVVDENKINLINILSVG